MEDAVIKVTQIADSFISCNEVAAIQYKHIEPIKLTEDWLEMFGFKDYGGNIFYREISQNGMRFFVNLDNNCIRLSNDNNFYSSPQLPIRTHFIHQLQNLWTALTATHITKTKI